MSRLCMETIYLVLLVSLVSAMIYHRLRHVAVGRIAGHDGKTKFTIENASRTRIVLADTYGCSIYTLHLCD